MSESKWKQICGKKISEGAYIGTESLREDYLRAMPTIAISTNGNGFKKQLDETKQSVGVLGKLLSDKDTEISDLKAMIEKLTFELGRVHQEQREVKEHFMVRDYSEERNKRLFEQMQQLTERINQLETKKNKKKKIEKVTAKK